MGNKYITHLEGPLIRVSPYWSPSLLALTAHHAPTFGDRTTVRSLLGGVVESRPSFTCFSGDRPDTAM